MAQSDTKLDHEEHDPPNPDQDDVQTLNEVICVKAIANSVTLNKLSTALFCINDGSTLVRVAHFVGNPSWMGIGHFIRLDEHKTESKEAPAPNSNSLVLFKEEALFLLESGVCEVLIQYKLQNEPALQTCVGLRNAFTLFFASQSDPRFDFNIYTVFKRLVAMGYVLKRTEVEVASAAEQHAFLRSRQSALSQYFERTSFWLWKRRSSHWWSSLQQGFQSRSVRAVEASLRKLYAKKPDALLLIKRRGAEKREMHARLLSEVVRGVQGIPVMIARASQNDVLLFTFESVDL